MDTTRLLAWTARLLGTTLLAFLLFMLVGALTGDVSSPDGFRFRDGKDLLGFVLFPVGTIIGLLLAPIAGHCSADCWPWERPPRWWRCVRICGS